VKIRIPDSVEQFSRIWAAIPFPLVLAWAAAENHPTLAEELDQLEAQPPAEP
jgi:hypothetical protein